MGLTELAKANPWPSEPPEAPAVEWGWGVAGEGMLRDLVSPDIEVVVEVGSLLGGSARFWAQACPRAHVICIDPWIDVSEPADRPFLEHLPELTDFLIDRTDGLFDIFLASTWELRRRLTPIRAYSPDGLEPIHRHGVVPDVVYIDGSHVYEDVIADLATARALFPEALICGDDYNWPAVRAAVDYVVANRGDHLRHHDNTWAIEQRGDGTRRAARSARTVGSGEPWWPVRLATSLQASLATHSGRGSRPTGRYPTGGL